MYTKILTRKNNLLAFHKQGLSTGYPHAGVVARRRRRRRRQSINYIGLLIGVVYVPQMKWSRTGCALISDPCRLNDSGVYNTPAMYNILLQCPRSRAFI